MTPAEIGAYARGLTDSMTAIAKMLGDLEAPIDTQRPHHGDRWENRNGRAVVVASNDWPPPAPGTHETDEVPGSASPDWPPDVWADEYFTAMNWSRQNNPERHA